MYISPGMREEPEWTLAPEVREDQAVEIVTYNSSTLRVETNMTESCYVFINNKIY